MFVIIRRCYVVDPSKNWIVVKIKQKLFLEKIEYKRKRDQYKLIYASRGSNNKVIWWSYPNQVCPIKLLVVKDEELGVRYAARAPKHTAEEIYDNVKSNRQDLACDDSMTTISVV